MSCGCNDVSCEFQESTERKARKPHRCDECDTRIQPGETYRYLVGKYDGDICSSYFCLVCAAWGDAFVAAARAAKAECDCWAIGSFWSEALPEFCREVLGYDPSGRESVQSMPRLELLRSEFRTYSPGGG